MKKSILLYVALLAIGMLIACKSGKSTIVEVVRYTDLGLKSGTLWKKVNEGTFSFDSAYSIYGENIPTKEQKECIEDCVR